MNEPSEVEIEAIKAKVAPRELHQLSVENDDDGLIMLVSAPTKAEWLKYVSDLTGTEDVAKKSLAHESFILAVTQYPEREIVKAYLNKYAAVSGELCSKITEIAGAGANVRAKKL